MCTSVCTDADNYLVCFSDAFELQYGVCVLRMKEGLDISHPPQSHSKMFTLLLV